MEYKLLLVTKEDGVATIQMNSPQTMNCLEDLMLEELLASFSEAEQDPEVKVVILTGAGKAFCAGGDVRLMKKGFATAHDGYLHIKNMHGEVARTIYNMDKPVIAAVNGFAVGAGFSLTLLADITFASENAKFGAVFSNVGLTPDYAMMYTLPRLVGMKMAKELAFTARQVKPDEGKALGFVNRVVAPEALMEETMAFAKQLAQGATLSQRLTKRAFNAAADMTFAQASELEWTTQGILYVTEDHRNAVQAFVNKEKPVFVGR